MKLVFNLKRGLDVIFPNAFCFCHLDLKTESTLFGCQDQSKI